MSRLLLLPVLLSAALGLVALLVPRAVGMPASGHVYTVAEARALLAREPHVWTGRTVLVRALADDCYVTEAGAHNLQCRDPRPTLGDPDAPVIDTLPLRWEAPLLPLALLRRLPLFDSLVPAPQVIRWEMVATYRVRFEALTGHCGTAICYEAVLPDVVAQVV